MKAYTKDGYTDYIVDTFVSNMEGIKKIIKSFFPSTIDNITVHYWEPNIDACKINDENRRSLSSAISIENAELDIIPIGGSDAYIKELQEFANFESNGRIPPSAPAYKEIKVSLERHQTYPMPHWQRKFAQLGYHFSGKSEAEYTIRSSSWCLGGSWGDCWGNSGSVGSEPQPEFSEFDKILSKLSPEISFLKYKKIYGQCVSINTSSEGDHYGGQTENAWYEFKPKLLYDLLVEEGLLKD